MSPRWVTNTMLRAACWFTTHCVWAMNVAG